VDLISEYKSQYGWRAWPTVYRTLPDVAGSTVLDLGCGIGDQARDLASRGARVVGIDGNPQLVAHASSRHIPHAVFKVGDLRQLDVKASFDGVWASFAAAYFPDFGPVLASWCERVRPGGWIAMVEMSGLFSHEPLSMESAGFAERYVADAARAGRYEFDMGAKLAGYVRAAGLTVETSRVIPDAELSFAGKAGPEVMKAWNSRFDRMQLLMRRAEVECPTFRADFLGCLASEAHVSRCQVHFCLARRT
jgi:SAM-dependent methyltransferase